MTEELKRIGELLRTQDNRITHNPIFIIEEEEKIWGVDSEYDYDGRIWINHDYDYDEIEDERLLKVLDYRYQYGEDIKNYGVVFYRTAWKFVTACFTEKGCEDFIKIDGHNHGKLRIYAHGSYRNAEFNTIRDYLMGLK